ncbi:unnamed protein product [Urochloa humidicola]
MCGQLQPSLSSLISQSLSGGGRGDCPRDPKRGEATALEVIRGAVESVPFFARNTRRRRPRRQRGGGRGRCHAEAGHQRREVLRIHTPRRRHAGRSRRRPFRFRLGGVCWGGTRRRWGRQVWQWKEHGAMACEHRGSEQAEARRSGSAVLLLLRTCILLLPFFLHIEQRVLQLQLLLRILIVSSAGEE